jgi:hypothetical protein
MSKDQDKETARIRDEALKRAFSMPHIPHSAESKLSAKKKGRRAPVKKAAPSR